ncbi:restriction endonuclease subunit S [Brevibacillus agri]|uniref:restriction endonuclease subunit S n=1 Tax=Brevibacillus agri TaxID=51101 RepID=UPI0004708375|nr:restriction endonuclease subunit S [Brevibacillus agri]MBY0054868.1 restriction endonuclease subunit S [Brevibacillus agri]WHX31006.1 restriction endonuclease subunit S [Brevibacillus agri]
MSKWDVVRLSEVISLSSGRFLPSSKRVDGIYNVYGGNGVSGNHNEYFIDDPTVVIGRVGEYCGCVHVTEPKVWVTDNALYVTNYLKDIELKYLCYVLQNKNLNRYANKSGQPSISQSSILKQEIPLPPLETQKQIAKILDTAAELLAMRKQQLAELENLIKSVFNEMFGDPVTNEKGWKAEAGSQIYVFSSGKFNPSHQLDDSYEYPCYGGNGITGRSKEYLIDYQTLVIGRVGAYCGSIHLTSQKSWITDNAIYLKQYDKSKFELEFLKMLFTELNFNRFADFSGQPKITQKPLLELSYICPPRSLQTKFATIVTRIEEQKSLVKKALEETQYLFDSLMSQYFE